MCQVSTSGIFLFPRYWVKWGIKTVQNGFFLDFLKKLKFDLVHSPKVWRSNDITYACKLSIPDNILFLKYELLFDLKITKTSKCCNFQPPDASELS